MRQNVGETDRVVRGVIGIWLVMTAISAFRSGRKTVCMVTGIAGLGLLQNALTGFCGANWLFGVDTTSE
ncbi:YgaP family membrane protein [Halococcus hamelinensis]|uniref:Inner membrane protein YgaP-like transmembrane domain-containing protein n=1 Tax=Halococcus hamelinensis 100A6 TaxID=1132509 RepID=M0M2W3_9EURY|nr:DUF2892 domain-containing protein [Halococcus hamelinensis]EMA40152.1 hypothetical protein C447_04997 [Halococcus hamelinensis 100A6]